MSEPVPMAEVTRPLPEHALALAEAHAYGWCMRCRADRARLVLVRREGANRFNKAVLCSFCISEAPASKVVVIDQIRGGLLDKPQEHAEPPLASANVVTLFPGA